MVRPAALTEYERVLRQTPAGSWIIEFPDLPGCKAEADTSDEAFLKGEAALADFVARAASAGMPLPQPGSSRRVSGSLKLRVPVLVHERLHRVAEATSISLSALVLRLLYAGVNRLEGDEADIREACAEADGSAVRKGSSERERRFSGVWVQRMPRELHFHLQWLAGEQGVSHNLLINCLIALELGRCELLLELQPGKTPKGNQQAA